MAGSLKTVQLRPVGLNQDSLPGDLNGKSWTAVENMTMEGGYLRAARRDQEGGIGSSPTFDSVWFVVGGSTYQGIVSIPYYLASVVASGSTRLYVYDGSGTEKNVSPASWGSIANQDKNLYTGCFFNGNIIINHPDQAPHYWGMDFATPTNAARLTDWAATDSLRGAIRPFGDFLLAINANRAGSGAGGGSNTVFVSDRAAAGAIPSTWTSLATNEATDLELGESAGPLIDGAELGSVFLCYKRHSMYMLQQTGLPEVMTARKMPVTQGVLARNCIREIGGVHYVLGPDDVYVTNGREAKSIISGSNRNYLFDNINSVGAKFENCYTAYDHDNKEFWVCFPVTGASDNYPTEALIYSLERQAWSRRLLNDVDMIFSAGSPTTDGYLQITDVEYSTAVPRRRLVAVNPGATLADEYLLSVGTLTTNEVYSAEVTHVRLNPGGAATVSRVLPVGTFGQDFDVSVGVADHPDQAMTWGTAVTYDASAYQPVTVTARGRYHGFRIQKTSSNTNTDQLVGFDIEYEESGRW